MKKKIVCFALFLIFLLIIVSGCTKNQEISYNQTESKHEKALPIKTPLAEKLEKMGDLDANSLAIFNNIIYVGAQDGIYQIEKDRIEPSDTTLGTITSFAIYNNNFYAGGNKGIFVLNGSKWVNASKPPDVRSDYGDVVWQILNHENVLYAIKGEIFKGGKLFRLIEGEWVNVSDRTFYKAMFYKSNLYAGGYQGVHTLKNNEWVQISTGDSALVSDFVEYRDQLYVSVQDKVFKLREDQLIPISSLYSPPSGYKFGIHDNRLYITTSDGIQVILSDNVWVLLKQGIYPRDYLSYNNELYLATEDGVFKYRPDERIFNSVIVGGSIS